MQITIPEFFIENDLLNTTKELSYSRYITREPNTRSSINIEGNVLIFVLKGTKVLHFNSEDKQIKSGDIVFLRSGNYLMTEILDDYYEGLIFFYSDKLLSDFITKYKIELEDKKVQHSNIFSITSSTTLQNGILSILPYFNSKEKKEEIVTLKFEEIFLNILNTNDSFKEFLSTVSKEDDAFKIKIEKGFENYESVKDLADFFKMTELSFREKFKSVFNTTPKKWIQTKKLAKAKVLLEKTDMNVSEVSIESGFENLSWFIQSFKKEFGTTPKQIKNNKN